MSKGTKSKTKLLIFEHWQEQAVTASCFTGYRSSGTRGGRNITQAFIRNVRGCLINEQNAAARSKQLLPRPVIGIRLSLLPNHRPEADRDVISSVGCIHSSEEVSVMEMERRGTVIQLEYL